MSCVCVFLFCYIGKYYIATMTMVTASTSLTIFIMNIHFCGAEAKPVPHWAKVLIIDYMSKIFFVYEVGENCSSSSSSPHTPQEDIHRENLSSHVHANGKRGSHKYSCPEVPEPQQHPRVKAQPCITREDKCHLSGYTPAKYEEYNGKVPTSDFCKEDQKVLCHEHPKFFCGHNGKNPPLRGPVVPLGPCVFCSYGSSSTTVNTRLVCNVEYIANCFREQRATCAKGAEWKKIAKVMDRFFMWLFFIMVFLMSILIIGKAP